MNGFADITFLQNPDIMVPFLFSLAVSFGALNAANVFKNKGVNFIIAISLSIFAITSPTYVNLLWTYFGDITLFFLAMFLVAFTLEIMGVRRKQVLGGEEIVIYSGILFIILTLGFYHVDKIPSVPFLGSGQNALLLLAVVVIFSIFWAAFKYGKAS